MSGMVAHSDLCKYYLAEKMLLLESYISCTSARMAALCLLFMSKFDCNCFGFVHS